MERRPAILGSLESEIALVIRNHVEDVVEDIASLTSISGYDLRPAEFLRIRDTYFDTTAGDLRRKMIALRVRRIDGIHMLSMKSNPKKMVGSGTRRREVELPWSYSSLHRLASELNLKPLRGGIKRFSSLTIPKTLGEIGLKMIQERLTNRRARRITWRNKPTSTLAELDIDEVTYLDEAMKVRLFEIEIEAKAPRALSSIRRIADTLLSNYPDSLRKWDHGKFATGLAIRRLLKEGRLQAVLDHDRLRPEAFPLIDQTIRSAGVL